MTTTKHNTNNINTNRAAYGEEYEGVETEELKRMIETLEKRVSQNSPFNSDALMERCRGYLSAHRAELARRSEPSSYAAWRQRRFFTPPSIFGK